MKNAGTLRAAWLAAMAVSVFCLLMSIRAEAAGASKSAKSGKSTYACELSGKQISTELRDQRPIAVMIDDDQLALPHCGLEDADIVYELVNSTANNRITRLMAIYKDYNKVTRIGSIRSTRPTNILLAEEYGAVLCHDGGPYYNDIYFKDPAIQHLSGGFTRISNGKAREFTEFITAGEVRRRMKAAGISSSYPKTMNKEAKKEHFRFSKTGTTLNKREDAKKASSVSLPYANTRTRLVYNEKTKTYDLYQHGTLIRDGISGKTVSFDNVIVMDCSISVLDKHGYLIYNCLAANQPGYFLTRGYAIPILWTKNAGTDPTKYFTETGAVVTLNPGKTYITMCPSDSWKKLSFGRKTKKK